MEQQRTYRSALSASERSRWRLDQVLPEDSVFDFGQPFLPEALAHTAGVSFLDVAGRLALNHIRARGYLGIFALAEEAILPFVLAQAQGHWTPQHAPPLDDRLRALVGFADEEAKHIALFRRFAEIFDRDFPQRVEVIGPATAVTQHIRSHCDLGVALLILHIEYMTQRHYVEQVRDAEGGEPHFRSLLRHHWIEEAQHARLDGELVAELAAGASSVERRAAVDDYVALLSFLDAALQQQVALDCAALEKVLERHFQAAERALFMQQQRRSQREVFLLSGLDHVRVREALTLMDHAWERRVQPLRQQLSDAAQA